MKYKINDDLDWELSDHTFEKVIDLLERIRDLPISGPRENAIDVLSCLRVIESSLKKIERGIDIRQTELESVVTKLLTNQFANMQRLIKLYSYSCGISEEQRAEIDAAAKEVETKVRKLGAIILAPPAAAEAPTHADFALLEQLRKSSTDHDDHSAAKFPHAKTSQDASASAAAPRAATNGFGKHA